VRVVAVVLAAGRSERLSGDVPKPFLLLGPRPMLDYSLAALAACPEVDAVVVAVPADRRDTVAEGLLASAKVVAVTAGGPSRQDSLARALVAVPDRAEIVLVHDAARPMVTPELARAVLEAVSGDYAGALAAVPLDDAIKEVATTGEVLGPRSRGGLWRAQTPQAFLRPCLADGLSRAQSGGIVCDDCSELLTGAGYRVRVVPGDPRNIKVTRPADLEVCERLLAGRAP
jgi:2-C-methyl-D-erythritol 4-phosphate cytidylyltransferase